MTIRIVAAALLLGLMTTASSAAEMDMRHGRAATPAEAANAAAMSSMMKNMDIKSSGDPDKDFARMMLAHHRGAVAMAEVELRYGKDPAMRTLATNIIAAQKREITQMEAWLAAH